MDGQLNRRHDAGITLIELVVVVAVLAVLAVGVSLVPMGAADQSAAKDANRFAARVAALQDRAIHGRMVTGLRLSSDGFVPVARDAEGWRDIGPVEPWAGRVTLSGRAPLDDTPDIVLLPSGHSSAFDIRFGTRRCRSDGWEPVQCDR